MIKMTPLELDGAILKALAKGQHSIDMLKKVTKIKDGNRIWRNLQHLKSAQKVDEEPKRDGNQWEQLETL